MDAEAFQIWKESTATQWVLSRVQAKADQIKATLGEHLYNSTGLTPDEWAGLQARAGTDKGVAVGLDFICNLDFEDIDDGQSAEIPG